MEREERPTQEGAPPLVLAMSYLVLEPGRDRTCERASRAGWCASAIKRETVVLSYNSKKEDSLSTSTFSIQEGRSSTFTLVVHGKEAFFHADQRRTLKIK
ncbi:hypothetical protein HZH66_012214 [Vespula vulgaris]|uniref:Uncharacterized protein n=1 Tax=Vespula vulgaris TaxID=7454 RepID=A0A834MW25_VESVU|nr:hypothetical protein HZH66_012214 [Vespula vulgaris]